MSNYLTTRTAKTALVTGASSVIGKAAATKLLTLGYTVHGAARHADRLSGVAGRSPAEVD
ncbi:hypothetical protein ABZ912_54965 [Nonomuraea angiospora]|uniref:hypothetical protein n=1 Tax=Nonomuraea angiospora TaxID=46172 RepID=UPI00340FC0E5